MTEENVSNIKKKYKELTEMNNNLSSLLEIKERLEALDIVKQYMKVLGTLETYRDQFPIKNNLLTEDELLNDVIKSEKINDTNNIYVYQASFAKYCYRKSRGYYRVAVDDKRAEYHVYLDIEKDYNRGAIEIPASERKKFESENKVIYPVNQFPMSCYDEVKKKFYQTIISDSQEKAIEKILK